MEEDDSMEIDETIPAAPIIERRSDEFSPNNSLTEKKSIENTDVIRSKSAAVSNTERVKTPPQVLDNTSNTKLNKAKVDPKSNEKQVDVVILDDDDEDEPMETSGDIGTQNYSYFNNLTFSKHLQEFETIAST